MEKKIHQIWFQGKENIPAKYSKYIKTTKETNPDWIYFLWDGEMLEKECLKYSQACLDKFKAYPYLHQKIDLGRYVVLYNNGGISVDMDAKAVKPLSQIPGINKKKMIVSKLNLNAIESLLYCQRLTTVNNAHIYCPQNNLAMKKIIDSMIEQPPIPSDTWLSKEMQILYTTGPYQFSQLVADNNNQDQIIQLPFQYFEPKTLGDDSLFPETIIIHDTDGTWLSGIFQHIYKIYVFLKQNLVFIILCVFVLFLFYKIVSH